MMLRNFHSYKQFLESYERIATDILADRLRNLEKHGIITTQRGPRGVRAVLSSLPRRRRTSRIGAHDQSGQDKIPGRCAATLDPTNESFSQWQKQQQINDRPALANLSSAIPRRSVPRPREYPASHRSALPQSAVRLPTERRPPSATSVHSNRKSPSPLPLR